MKHIKTYLNLALTIAFCASINTLAMENSDQSVLQTQINELQTIHNIIHNTLKLGVTYTEKEKLKTIHELAQKTIGQARDMLLGHLPIDTQFIDQQIKSIEAQWNKIPFYILLKKQIYELHTINNIINNALKFRMPISKYEQLSNLLKFAQKTIAQARDMLLGILPIDTEFIDQQTKSIKAQWNNIY